jgi:hypothetical protein
MGQQHQGRPLCARSKGAVGLVAQLLIPRADPSQRPHVEQLIFAGRRLALFQLLTLARRIGDHGTRCNNFSEKKTFSQKKYTGDGNEQKRSLKSLCYPSV